MGAVKRRSNVVKAGILVPRAVHSTIEVDFFLGGGGGGGAVL